MTNFIVSEQKFFETMKEIVKIEMCMTQKLESRVYAFVQDKEGQNHVTMKPLPDKDFNNSDIFELIAETALHINGFRSTMKEDGFKEKALFHVELFRNTGEQNKTILVVVCLVCNKNGKVETINKDAFEVVGGDTIVDDEGNMKTSKLKLVTTNFLND